DPRDRRGTTRILFAPPRRNPVENADAVATAAIPTPIEAASGRTSPSDPHPRASTIDAPGNLFYDTAPGERHGARRLPEVPVGPAFRRMVRGVWHGPSRPEHLSFSDRAVLPST